MLPSRARQRIDVSGRLDALAALHRAELELVEAGGRAHACRRSTASATASAPRRDRLARRASSSARPTSSARARTSTASSSARSATTSCCPTPSGCATSPSRGRPPRGCAGLAIPLAYPLVEAEVAERQQPAIVDVDAARPPLRRARCATRSGWSAYVVVALPLSGATAGMLHADARRPLDEVDLAGRRDLRRRAHRARSSAPRCTARLQHHRQELRGAVAWMSERLAHAGPAGRRDSLGDEATRRRRQRPRRPDRAGGAR